MKQFVYTQTDKNPQDAGKSGKVVLFDPEPERLTAWIANAVIETSPNHLYNEGRALQFIQLIKKQSHAQFPVVGLVWEDMDNSGHPKAYGFLDGITVVGAPSSIYKNDERTSSKLNDSVLNELLMLRWVDKAKAGSFARVASTTASDIRQLYKSIGATPPSLDGLSFPTYVREKYIKAMSGVRNELLVARAHAIK